MKGHRHFGVLSILFAASVLLGGCLDEKRDRITDYEPGVYKGRPDSALSAAKRRELQYRTTYQSGVTAPAGGGLPAPSSGSVRTPSDSMARTGQLNTRAENQKGP